MILFRPDERKLIPVYVFLFLNSGIMSGFLPAYLSSEHLTADFIALGIGIGTISRIVSSIGSGIYVDSHNSLRKTMFFFVLLSAIVGFLLSLFHSQELFLLYILIQAVTGPLLSLSDTSSAYSASQQNANYSKVRSFGSISFGIGALGSGVLFDHIGLKSLPYVLLLNYLLMFLSCIKMPDFDQSNNKREKKNLFSTSKDVLKRKEFLQVLFTCIPLHGSNGFMFAFGSIYWSGFLTKTEIGAIWFIGVLAEFLFFIRGDSCFKFLQYRGFMTLAILSGFTCWLICGLSHSFVIILIARILGGVSFATTHISAVKSLSNGAGGPNRATSMTLYGVLAWSLPTGLIGWGSVILYNSGGGHNGEFGFIIMAVITLLSIPFIFMNKKRENILN